MEYAWIVSGGQPITPEHLPHDVRNPRVRDRAHARAHTGNSRGIEWVGRLARDGPIPIGLIAGRAGAGGRSLADVEMEYILQVYAKNNLNKQATATELGISLKTLYNKLHKYEEERRMRAG